MKLQDRQSEYFPALPRHRAASKAKVRSMAVYCIEGDSVNIDQVAARLGLSNVNAHSVCAHVRKQPGPVTWAALEHHAANRRSRNARKTSG